MCVCRDKTRYGTGRSSFVVTHADSSQSGSLCIRILCCVKKEQCAGCVYIQDGIYVYIRYTPDTGRKKKNCWHTVPVCIPSSHRLGCPWTDETSSLSLSLSLFPSFLFNFFLSHTQFLLYFSTGPIIRESHSPLFLSMTTTRHTVQEKKKEQKGMEERKDV